MGTLTHTARTSPKGVRSSPTAGAFEACGYIYGFPYAVPGLFFFSSPAFELELLKGKTVLQYFSMRLCVPSALYIVNTQEMFLGWTDG